MAHTLWAIFICITINTLRCPQLDTDGAFMKRVQGQIVAGIDYLPVVDVNYRPILLGSRLRATVATYTGHLVFHEVTVEVTDEYLPYCVIRGESWCIPFYYDSDRRVMVGAYLSRTFPVWCELLPATTPFYSRS